MYFSTMVLIIGGMVLLLIFGGACFLEYRLAKKEEAWMGLILPIAFFFTGILPGLILFCIYVVGRNKIKKQKEIDEMKIRDL